MRGKRRLGCRRPGHARDQPERAAGRRADIIDLDTAHLRHVQAEYLRAWAEAHRALRAEVVRRKTRARSGAPAARCIGAHHAAKEIAAILKAWSRHRVPERYRTPPANVFYLSYYRVLSSFEYG